jgi:hypothetical protein
MEEEKFEKIVLETNADTGEPVILMHDRNVKYIPTEFQIINYKQSWKKCHCGRQTWFNDNFCPGCGQRLGKPENYGED